MSSAADQLQRLNTAFETIAGCRDRHAAQNNPGPARLTTAEMSEVASVIADNAAVRAHLALGLARAADDLVPRDHRGLPFIDYESCSLYRLKRNGDAYLNWHQAARASPPPSTEQLSMSAPQPQESKASTVEKSSEKEVLPMELRPSTRTRPNRHKSSSISGSSSSSSSSSSNISSSSSSSSSTSNSPGNAPDDGSATGATKSEEEMPLRPRSNARRGTETKKSKDAEASEVKKTVDSHNLGHVRNNMNFALAELKPDRILTADLPPLKELFRVTYMGRLTSSSITAPYHAFNPSIVPHPYDPQNEFLCILRAGNYHMNAQNRYEFPKGHVGVHSKNMLVTLPVDFAATDTGKSTQLKAPVPPYPYTHVAGEEDLRIVPDSQSVAGSDGSSVMVTFTSLEYLAEPKPQVCIATLDWRRGRLLNPVKCHGFEDGKPQKNWATFVHMGAVHAVYSFQPISVLRIDQKTGQCALVSLDACTLKNDWRGSSPLMDVPAQLVAKLPGLQKKEAVQTGDRWLACTVHVSHFPLYHHQWLVMRLRPSPHSSFRPFSLQVTHVTPPFVFISHNVEFNCGWAFNGDASEIVIPFAQRDEFCHLARITTDSWLAKLIEVPSPDDFVL